MKRVLFDSDVLLDILLERQPFFTTSALALDSVAQGKVEGYLAGHAVTNIFYLLRRQLGSEKSREVLNTLLVKMKVAAVTDAVIREALLSPFTDFEDAVAYAAANAEKLEAIITRNIKDFRLGSIPAIQPDIFITRIS